LANQPIVPQSSINDTPIVLHSSVVGATWRPF
jgi:hypothetical protein